MIPDQTHRNPVHITVTVSRRRHGYYAASADGVTYIQPTRQSALSKLHAHLQLKYERRPVLLYTVESWQVS